MIFDKNRKRIEELQKKDPVKYSARLVELESRGTEWWIRFKDPTGKPRDEKCPDDYQSENGAKMYYIERKKEVESCEYMPASHTNVKVSKILDYFRETKNNSSDTRTIHKELNRRFGYLNFQKIISEPLTIKKLTELMFSELSSQKYAWNHWIKLRAAFQNWIDLHNLNGRISNPCRMVEKLLKLEAGTNVREVCPTHEEFDKILMTCYQEGVSQIVIDLQEAVWESGLRIGEILKWRCEDMNLDLKLDEQGNIIEIPYFVTVISKQKRKTRVQIPMTSRLCDILKRVVSGRETGAVWPVSTPPYKHFNIIKLDDKGKEYTTTIFELAGLGHFRPFHDYRKSKKSNLKLQGYTSEYTKYLQGHATDSMDAYYTKFQRMDVQKVYIEEYRKIDCVTKDVTKNEKGD